MNKNFITAVAILTGTLIGAGFLGIPHAISKAGFIPGILLLALIALLMMFMKLYLGEVALRTKGTHQLAGYAEIYLGKTGKLLMFFATIFGIYSALIAYLIGEGESISYIIFGSPSLALPISIVFWILMAFLSFIGLTALKKYEKLGLFSVLAFLAVIVIFFIPNISLSNLTYMNPSKLFFPFGIILFSFLGFSAMPEVERVLIGKENLMKRTIITAILITFGVYAIFSFILVGKFGAGVPEISTLALGRFFSLLGVITMFTAFFSAAISVRDIFRFDFKIPRFYSWALAALIPFILFLAITIFHLLSFIQILSIAGVISGGITGILILVMNKLAKKNGNRKPEYSVGISWKIIILLSIVLISAVILELIL